MEMTEEEIIQRYKKAEGIQEQRAKLKILAELNGCNTKTIKNILSIHGIEPPSPHPREKKTVEIEEEVLKKGTDPEKEEKKCSVCAFFGMVAITLSIAFILLAVKWSKEDDKDERHSKN